ncbi:MAG: permease [Spirochaetaceae bacterium]
MNLTTIVINGLALGALGWAVAHDRRRTVQALRAALRSLLGMVPTVLSIILLIGLLLGFVPPETIRRLIGAESGIVGVLVATGIGGITLIPALISFPLAASLVESGAGIAAAAGFITSLTMIGTVTLPMEVRELGVRMTVARNILGLLAAVSIALIMGAVL